MLAGPARRHAAAGPSGNATSATWNPARPARSVCDRAEECGERPADSWAGRSATRRPRPPTRPWRRSWNGCTRSKSLDRPAPLEPADLYFLHPADRPDLLGTLGEYEVQEVIGQGGMGVVLKAFEPALHRLVAIKVLAPALAGSATARRRFTREAQAAAAVCHEHVVAVHGVHEADGLPYLVMQYVAGESLQDRLDRTGPLEVVEVVRIGMQTAAGLAAAHAQGLIHRDVKPANLLLEGRAWGEARFASRSPTSAWPAWPTTSA